MALGIARPASLHTTALVTAESTVHNHGPIRAGVIIDEIRLFWSTNGPTNLRMAPSLTHDPDGSNAAHASGVALFGSSNITINQKPAILIRVLTATDGEITLRSDFPIEEASQYVNIILNSDLQGVDTTFITQVTFKALPGFKP